MIMLYLPPGEVLNILFYSRDGPQNSPAIKKKTY